MNIAVAGGTGVAGSAVVREATERGHDVLVLARSTGCDLRNSEQLAQRLAGVDAVIDATNTSAQSYRRARAFFDQVTGNLLSASAQAGVGHYVGLSIVGAARVHTGYYRAKVHQEALVEASGLGWSILATTQFHEFAQQALGFVTVGRRSWVPGMLIAPVAVADVACHLVGAAEGKPGGRLRPVIGPEQFELVDLARQVNERRHLGRRVHGLMVPGAGGRAMRSGVLTQADDPHVGAMTFKNWL